MPSVNLSLLWEDDRAIEGLPVRLVVALVVGVASLSVMMNMVSGIDGLAVTELDVRPTPEVVAPGAQAVEVTVVDSGGDPVADATVVARGGTATIDGVETATTGPDGRATLRFDPGLGPNRETGEVTFAVKPPAGGGYVDRRENTALLVVAD